MFIITTTDGTYMEYKTRKISDAIAKAIAWSANTYGESNRRGFYVVREEYMDVNYLGKRTKHARPVFITL